MSDAGSAAVFIGILGVLLGGGILYGAMGGAGRIAAGSARRPTPPARLQGGTVTATITSVAAAPPSTAGAGFSNPAKLAAIAKYYENDLNAETVGMAELVPSLVTGASLRRVAAAVADKTALLKKKLGNKDALNATIGEFQESYLEGKAEQAFYAVQFQRSLRDMTDAERAALRLADILFTLGALSESERHQIRVPIIWNQGQSLMTGAEPFNSADRLDEFRNGVSTLFRGHFGEVKTATERLQDALRRALQDGSPVAQGDKLVLERYLFAGASWMTPEAAAMALVPKLPPRPSVLRLGPIRGSTQELLYDQNESLITIAPPGTGKSQGLMRNLLTMDGGALVIDIKGELYEKTAEWRRQNVGDVYRFAPSDLANSISFNPFDAVRANVEDAYEDAQKLVELMMVPGEGREDFWERRGLELLGDAILDIALNEQDTGRSVGSVFQRLFLNAGTAEIGLTPDSPLDRWAGHLSATQITKLMNAAESLRSMPLKMRDSVMQTARTHVNMWQSPRIERLTQRSTFDPLSLRRDKATVYICISLDELKQYASVLRAFIGQTFYSLCRGHNDRAAPVVTFFLDEMPKLGRLDILEHALDLGRGHGVRMWMFAQNYGQIEENYKNADGFLKNSLVRMHMGINGADSLRLSKELGERHGLLDGRRKPLVEPHQLSGEEFRDLILADIGNRSPAQLEKRPAYADPESVKKMMAPGPQDEPGILRFKTPKVATSSAQTPL